MKKAATATTQKHHLWSAIIPKSVAVAKGWFNLRKFFTLDQISKNQGAKSLI